jgi:hypothetical protein
VIKPKKWKVVRKKWFHHVGTLRVVKTEKGELRMRASGTPNDCYMTDSNVRDVFIWLGRYLAEKGKLPRHIQLDQIAVATQRSSKDIRAVIANEVFDSVRREKDGTDDSSP